MSTEYIPTTEEVRGAATYTAARTVTPEGFDRWLAAHDLAVATKAAAKALRDAADVALVDPEAWSQIARSGATYWLRARANHIEARGSDERA